MNLGRKDPSAVGAARPVLQPRLVAASAFVAALLSIVNAFLLPYEKAVALCGNALRSFEPLAGLPESSIYFLVGSAYGLGPLLLVGLVSGRLIRGRVLTHGLLSGSLFVLLLTPYLIAACSDLAIPLITALLAGLVVGAVSGGMGGTWMGAHAIRTA